MQHCFLKYLLICLKISVNLISNMFRNETSSETIYGSNESLTHISLLNALQEEVSQLNYEKQSLTKTLKRLEEEGLEGEKLLTDENASLKEEVRKLKDFQSENIRLIDRFAQLRNLLEVRDLELASVSANYESTLILVSKLEDELKSKNEIVNILRCQREETQHVPLISTTLFPPLSRPKPTWSSVTKAGKPSSRPSTPVSLPSDETLLNLNRPRPNTSLLPKTSVDSEDSVASRPSNDNPSLSTGTFYNQNIKPPTSLQNLQNIDSKLIKPSNRSNKFSVLDTSKPSSLVKPTEDCGLSNKTLSYSRVFYNQSKSDGLIQAYPLSYPKNEFVSLNLRMK